MGPEDPDNPFGDEPVELPLDGVLDLHAFRPQDARDVVVSYLEACREEGVLLCRVVHGKGTGTMRRSIQSLLGRLTFVEEFWSADEGSGGWGATWVRLKPPASV